MTNKRWAYRIIYYPPEQLLLAPGSRVHSLDETINATSAPRAIEKFLAKIGKEQQLRRDQVLVLGVQPGLKRK